MPTMIRKLIFSLLILILVVLPLLAATPTTPTEEANWWDKFGEPRYGGTINIREHKLQMTFDPWNPWNYCWYIHDQLFAYDWTLDRQIWNYQTIFIPEEYFKPAVAESWEWQDPQTCIIHIRKGVYWHDKPPANGREFTAYDVQYHYDRMLGTGSGFTEPNPNYIGFSGAIQQVTATDNYTVVAKFKQPAAYANFQAMFHNFTQFFELPELVESGEISDSNWKNAIGTAAYILTDYTQNTSATFDKNPKYWGNDERHPQNKLPYAEQFKMLCIPDMSTGIAALRTGKIDMLSDLAWLQAESLNSTNPEIQQEQLAVAPISLYMRCDHAPFTDINVRKALNMAIDRTAIAKAHYGGFVDGQPAGTVSPSFTGWCFPYAQWSQEVKDGHSYNPTKAKQLLANAGYPQGFETNAAGCSTEDVELMQIIQAYFKDIGVDMELRMMDFAVLMQFMQAGKHDQMCFAASNLLHDPGFSLGNFYSTAMNNYSIVNDPAYDAMKKNFDAATIMDEAQQLSREMDEYYIEHYWRVDVFPISTFVAWQPYLKGYSGESLGFTSFYWARLWIDQSLKESMRH